MAVNHPNHFPEMRWCVANGIRIYPEPTSIPDEYCLVVERNGTAERGEMVFGSKKLPGRNTWWEQIYLLYVLIFNQNNHEQNQENQKESA
jgi:hypothetical protein